MKGILFAKFRLFHRKPWLFVIMSGVCIMFAFFTSQGGVDKIAIPISVEGNSDKTEAVLNELNKAETFQFTEVPQEELKELVGEGNREGGLILEESDFTVIISSKAANVSLLQQVVSKVYSDIRQKSALEIGAEESGVSASEVSTWYEEAKESPVFTIEQSTFRGSDTFVYDPKLQSLFGFSLFFVIYTIAFNVASILMEKNAGVWDRMILSPVRKWEMYVGNLLYSFILGYIQLVTIFLVFRYITDVNFYGRFGSVLLLLLPYTFAIVALSMLITGLVKKVQHFNAVVPVVAVSMAMIGGAYWPLEIVDSPILLALSKVVPITYGMELLKGATINQLAIGELMFPISILVLMGVLMMGIGINFMEKRHI